MIIYKVADTLATKASGELSRSDSSTARRHLEVIMSSELLNKIFTHLDASHSRRPSP